MRASVHQSGVAFSGEEMSERICERMISAAPDRQHTHTHTLQKYKPWAIAGHAVWQICTSVAPSLNSMQRKETVAGSIIMAAGLQFVRRDRTKVSVIQSKRKHVSSVERNSFSLLFILNSSCFFPLKQQKKGKKSVRIFCWKHFFLIPILEANCLYSMCSWCNVTTSPNNSFPLRPAETF